MEPQSASSHEEGEIHLWDRVKVPVALKVLSLNSFQMGDYIVIMNGEADITILGEPYLALQVWLNTKSGTFIGRVWSQTISSGKVSTLAELEETCKFHFQRRPCLGYPLVGDQVTLYGEYVVSQSPLPRRLSKECQKVLSQDTRANVTCCTECLMLRVEMDPILDLFEDKTSTEVPFLKEENVLRQEDEVVGGGHVKLEHWREKRMIEERRIKFHCTKCPYVTNRASNVKEHVKGAHLKLGRQRHGKHNRSGPPICEHCGEGFTTLGHLKNPISVAHVITQTDETDPNPDQSETLPLDLETKPNSNMEAGPYLEHGS